MDYINTLFSNKTIIIPALTWFLAQAIKVFTSYFIYKKFDFRRWFGSGGMPSSHAAYVTSLAAVVAKNEGVGSTLFGISVAFSFIVMHDAVGVRQAAGKQAKLLNSLMSTHFSGEDFNEKLKELLGHKPLEVFVGAVMGLVFGVNFG